VQGATNAIPAHRCLLGPRSYDGLDKFYKLIREGQLVARKSGRRTLILAKDLQAFAESLPKIGGEA